MTPTGRIERALSGDGQRVGLLPRAPVSVKGARCSRQLGRHCPSGIDQAPTLDRVHGRHQVLPDVGLLQPVARLQSEQRVHRPERLLLRVYLSVEAPVLVAQEPRKETVPQELVQGRIDVPFQKVLRIDLDGAARLVQVGNQVQGRVPGGVVVHRPVHRQVRRVDPGRCRIIVLDHHRVVMVKRRLCTRTCHVKGHVPRLGVPANAVAHDTPHHQDVLAVGQWPHALLVGRP